MYEKVSTDLNFVDREKNVGKFWRCLLYTSFSTSWKRFISLAIVPLKTSRQIKFGIAISAFAMSEKVHAISSVVVAPTYAISEKIIL